MLCNSVKATRDGASMDERWSPILAALGASPPPFFLSPTGKRQGRRKLGQTALACVEHSLRNLDVDCRWGEAGEAEGREGRVRGRAGFYLIPAAKEGKKPTHIHTENTYFHT
jgi:hypothetical protein